MALFYSFLIQLILRACIFEKTVLRLTNDVQRKTFEQLLITTPEALHHVVQQCENATKLLNKYG